jgi:hypothetical protein
MYRDIDNTEDVVSSDRGIHVDSHLLDRQLEIPQSDTQQELDDGVKFIKSMLGRRRAECEEEIRVATLKSKKREADLKLLSPRNFMKWRKVQDMLAFLVVMRKYIKEARNSGMATHRKRGVASLSGEKKQLLRIYDDSQLLFCTTILSMLIWVYLVFVLPLDICFDFIDHTRSLLALEFIICGYFFCLILLRFFTVVYMQTGILESKVQIAKYYMSTWLFFDLLSVVPLLELLLGINIPSKRLFLLPQVLKNTYYFHHIADTGQKLMGVTHEKVRTVFRVNKVAFILSIVFPIVMFTHVCSCFWLKTSDTSEAGWISK